MLILIGINTSLIRENEEVFLYEYSFKTIYVKKYLISVVLFIVLVGFGVGIWVHDVHSHDVTMLTNAQHQLTQISYSGKNGTNAFVLLEQHAKVGYKHYSFGNFVTSIDGVVGNGPKYWTLYVNGKESTVGASDVITKNSDTITWKLQ